MACPCRILAISGHHRLNVKFDKLTKHMHKMPKKKECSRERYNNVEKCTSSSIKYVLTESKEQQKLNNKDTTIVDNQKQNRSLSGNYKRV